MVEYVTYAEKFGWTPEQADQLTIEQDDWIMPILNAVNAEREYKQKKAQEAQERKAAAERRRGFR